MSNMFGVRLRIHSLATTQSPVSPATCHCFEDGPDLLVCCDNYSNRLVHGCHKNKPKQKTSERGTSMGGWITRREVTLPLILCSLADLSVLVLGEIISYHIKEHLFTLKQRSYLLCKKKKKNEITHFNKRK